MQKRTPPQNTEAEMALLGAMLLSREAISRVRKLVGAGDFYDPKYGMLCGAIYSMYDADEAVDIVTAQARVRQHVAMSVADLAELVDACVSPENARHYAGLVVQAAARRSLIVACSHAVDMAYACDREDLAEFNADAQQILAGGFREVGDRRKSIEAADITTAVLNQLASEYQSANDERYYTGLYDIDNLTAGLHRQEVTIIGGRPGSGKTMYGVQLAQELARKGNHCLIVSREMSAESLTKRMISARSRINGQRLRQPKCLNDPEWAAIAEAAAGIITDGIRIDDAAVTIQEVRARCRELYDKGLLDCLFVDYITLLRSSRKSDSRRIEVEDISWQLKEISKEFDIPVVVLAQLNRASAAADREPSLHDLRETGAIEQDADNVILLHPVERSPEEQEADPEPDLVDVKAIIAKQRNGPTRWVMLKQHKKTFRFSCVVKGDMYEEMLL